MEIDFLKMQGCGDDVVVVDGTKLNQAAGDQMSRLASRMLDRTRGVGGSELVVLGHASGPILPVRCLDPDGDDRDLPCNAARCAARYASDSGAVNANDFRIDCMNRKTRAQIIDSAHVRVDMGTPLNREKAQEIRESLRESFTRSLLVKGRTVTYTPISLGRSYAMIFVQDFSFPVRRTAREIAEGPEFPEGTGIGFVQVCSREELRLRTWEAPGEPSTDECASACAALVASVVNGLADREAFVRLRAGDLFLQWDEADHHIWVTGPAAYIFTGTYDFPAAPADSEAEDSPPTDEGSSEGGNQEEEHPDDEAPSSQDSDSPGPDSPDPDSAGIALDSFIDRLAEFLRGLMGDREGGPSSSRGPVNEGSAGSRWQDPDLRAAWEELEDYLGSGSERHNRAAGRDSGGQRAHRPEPPADESLRQDFKNLEVPFGADIETVRRSYKALILRYHPDKFASDPERQRVALEITKKINESFERIRNRRG